MSSAIDLYDGAQGLWMWSDPIPRRTPDGRPYHLILLDTEGIGAYDQTGQYSIQIFSLAVLLSSMFIYNQMGGIDEAALDRLSLVTEMTKVRAYVSSASCASMFQVSSLESPWAPPLRQLGVLSRCFRTGSAAHPRAIAGHGGLLRAGAVQPVFPLAAARLLPRPQV